MTAFIIIYSIVLISILCCSIFFGYFWDNIRSKMANIGPGDILLRKADNPFDYDEYSYKTVVEVRKGKNGKYIKWYFSDKEGNPYLDKRYYHTELYIPSEYFIENHIEL